MLQRGILNSQLFLQFQFGDQQEFPARFPFLQFQSGEAFFQLIPALATRFGIAEFDRDCSAVTAHPGVGDLCLAQGATDIAGIRLQRLVQCRFHIHLHQEVHAAAQVEAEIHRQRVHPGQPGRRTRQQIERDHIILAQRGLQHVLGLELAVGVGKTRLDAGGVERQHFRRELCILQGAVHACQQSRIRFQVAAQWQHLHRG